ncbi:dTDP-4-dehydrorhamnose 3,5-epimerase family protein [Streptomyces sp. L7]
MRCSYGRIFDVVVDLRRTLRLTAIGPPLNSQENHNQLLYIPAGCAHGFQALTEPPTPRTGSTARTIRPRT